MQPSKQAKTTWHRHSKGSIMSPSYSTNHQRQRLMHEVIVLIPGYAEWEGYGKQRAAGTITLIKGDPNVIVDTGVPSQKKKIIKELKKHGLTPNDIRYVVLTHGQSDHIGNNNLFPKATFILDVDVSREDLYWVHDFHEDAFHIGEKNGDIAIIPTPGHTEHDLSVIVETPQGTIAIVGDLFEHENDWIDHSWEQWSKKKEEQKKSREKILRIADYIVPGHGDMFKVPSLTDTALAPTHAKALGQDAFIKRYKHRIVDLAEKWKTHWSRVDAERIEKWLRQFRDYLSMQSIYPLLENIIYLDDARIGDIFEQFSQRILQEKGERQVLFSTLGGLKDSSSFISYLCSKIFPEPERRNIPFDNIETLSRSYAANKSTVVFLDDTINTGQQAVRIFKEWFGVSNQPLEHVKPLAKETIKWLREAQIMLFVFIGFREGMDYFKEELHTLGLSVRVEAGRVEDATGCFDPGSLIFENPQVRLQAKKLAAEIGEELFKDRADWDENRRQSMALGYNNAQKLIVFSYNTPNCTLPIFWKKGIYNGQEWLPLFPRRD